MRYIWVFDSYFYAHYWHQKAEQLKAVGLENDKLKAERESAIKQVATLFQTVEYLTKEGEKGKNDMAALEAANKQLAEEIDSLNTSRSLLEEDNRRTQTENEILQREYAMVESEKEQLLSEISTLRIDKQALQSENEVIQAEKEALQSEKEALQAEKDVLECSAIKQDDDVEVSSFIPETLRSFDRRDTRMSILPAEFEMRNIDVGILFI